MPVSTIGLIKERTRQSFQEDEKFLSRILYFFEMIVPDEVATLGGYFGFVFPLIIPPESYSISEPFAMEATPTQGGGLYVEENGIIQRHIRLSGNTGFKPRPLKLKLWDAFPAKLDTANKSYSRELPSIVLAKLSGQKHFQYLQDAVFRTYADLKRDPSTAADTHLIFHNPRDDEHWLVKPEEFSLSRDSSSPLLYNYNIELLAVDKADAVRGGFSEDKGVFETLKDSLRTIKAGVDLVTGAINDITAVVGEVRSFVKDIGKILDSVTDIVNAATNLINGVTDLIEAPFAFLESTIRLVDAAIENIEAFVDLGTFPEHLHQKFKTLVDGLETLGSNPASWESKTDSIIRDIRTQQEFRRSVSQTRKEDALTFGSPSSFASYGELGTQLTAGDAQSADGEIIVGGEIRKFKSAREVVISEGDTLAGLASRYLGDARAWQYIAIINGLKPPFLDRQASAPLVSGVGPGALSGSATGADESPFPKTLGVGSKILIPSNQRSALDYPILPVVGVKAEESAEKQFLGTDLALEPVYGSLGSSRALYDIPINSELGSVDAKTVSGVDNLAQSVIIRLATERGTDILYKNLGVQKIVGLGFAPLDLALAKFRILDAILADSRVAAVHDVKFSQGETADLADQLVVDLKVSVRGFNESRPVRVTF